MDKKTQETMKMVLIIVVIIILLFLGYYIWNNMKNKQSDNTNNMVENMQNDASEIKDDIQSGVENIGEGVKDGAAFTIQSIENLFKDAGDVVKTGVDRIEGMKYKDAQKYKVDNEEFTVYEFENEEDLEDSYKIDEKFKNMIRKGNLLIETTSDKIKEKINELK